jgi:hypothetical protein
MPLLFADPAADSTTAKTENTGIANSAGTPLFRIRAKKEDDGLLAANPLKGRFGAPIATTDSTNSGESLPANLSESASQTDSPEIATQQSSSNRQFSQPTIQDELLSNGIRSAIHPNLGGELLVENPLTGAVFGVSEEDVSSVITESSKTVSDSNQTSDTELAENLTNRGTSRNAPTTRAEHHPDKLPAASFFLNSPQATSQSPLSAASQRTYGHWMRDDNLLTFKYVGSGHTDRFTAKLVEWTVALNNEPEIAPSIKVFADTFSNPKGPGQCAQCHNPVAGIVPGETDRWRAIVRDPSKKLFTRFNHAPHTLLADCQSCHALGDYSGDSGVESLPPVSTHLASWKETGSSASRTASTTGLKPVTPTNCATCHRTGGSPNTCTTCHNYHVTGSPSALPAR